MESSTPRERLAKAVGRFREDAIAYPYVKIWCALWMVLGLVAFIGGVMLAAETRANRDTTYRLSVQDSKRVALPQFRFDVVSGTSTSFTTFACATQGGQVVPLKPCGLDSAPESCLETDGPVVYALPTDNKLTCILAGISGDTNFMVKVSSPGNPDYRLFSTYIRSTNGAVVYVDQVTFTAHSSKMITHTLASEYYTASAQPGVVNIDFVVPTFEFYNWIQWSPFSGWNAFGTIGGTIFFIYILHALCMTVVALFTQNPWDPNFQREEYKPLQSAAPSYSEPQDSDTHLSPSDL